MLELVKTLISMLFSPNGRLSRGAYNTVSLLGLLIPASLIIIDVKFLKGDRYIWIISILILIYFCFWNLSIGRIKRVHDLDKEWKHIFSEGPKLRLEKGTKGANQYGPDPLEKKKNS